MNEVEALIIGAGASGSTAAFHLAKAGINVKILEKNSQISIKACGGGMAASVQKWFPFDLKPVVENIIKRVEFTWDLDDTVTAELPGNSPFWIVNRENFDEFITNKAIEEGAELVTNFHVDCINKKDNLWQVKDINGKEFYSRALIIANGSTSPWPKLFGLGPKNQHHASTISVRLKGKGSLKEGTTRFEFGLVKHGFAWAFPLKDEVNVGVGTFIGKNKLNSSLLLEKFLPSIGFSSEEGIRKEASLRVWNGHSLLHAEGIVAVGDAASLCDPFLAEGLRPSLMSGYEAAKSIKSWLNGDSKDLRSYSENMRKNWGTSMAWGRRISQVFYRFPKVGYQLGIKRPTAPERISQILSGEMGYEDIAQRVIKRLVFNR